jgi:O-antigen/teichoic acid export membrane protein
MLNKLNKLRAKLSWSLGGNLIYALSQWLIVTVIARFGSAEDLGVYSLGLAITAPIVLFFNFQLRTILATDRKNEYNFPQYLGGRIIHLSISFIIVMPVAILYSDDKKTIIVIILMGLVKYFEALSDICMGYFQKKGKVDIIGKSQFYRGIITAVIVSLLYITTQNIILSTLGLLFVMVLRLMFYDIRHLKPYTKVTPVFGISWFNLVKMAFPLGMASLISSLNTNIPRYFLDYFWGVEEVGIFSALYYVLIAGNMFLTPISLLAAPKIANAYNKEKINGFVKVNIQLSVIVSVIFSIFILIIIAERELILIILYGKEYAYYQNSFVVISFSMLFGFLTTFFALSAVAARVIKIQPFINFIVMIITLLASYFCIRANGVLGASYSLLISRFFQMLFSLGLLLFIIWVKKKKE